MGVKISKRGLVGIGIILIMVVLASGIAFGANCGGITQCSCGDTLTSNHNMWYDLNNCPGDGLIIGTKGITLNCKGHEITSGNKIGVDYGIYLKKKNYNSVINCLVGEFFVGIYLNESSNTVLRGNIAQKNRYGILLDSGSKNYLIDNEANDNTYGISLYGSSYNNLTSNTAYSNGYGIRLYLGNYNNITDNDIISNDLYGAYLDDSQYNTFWSNNFTDNDVNAYELADANNNNWNLSNVGNYWDDFYDNPGFPYQYEVSGPGDGIDYYPISDYEPVECGDMIYEDTKLYEDLHCNDIGIIFGADNITLDCNDHIIHGSAFGVLSTGVYNHHGSSTYHSGLTIKNCEIYNFTYGIRLTSTYDNILENNDCSLNEVGIELELSFNNTVKNNKLHDNMEGFEGDHMLDSEIFDNEIYGNAWGIDMQSRHTVFVLCGRNLLYNNNITNNSRGITFTKCDNNTIFNNRVIGNSDKGFEMWYSYGNNISYNKITGGNYGFDLLDSSGNNMWGNDILNTLVSAYEDSSSTNNWNLSTIGNTWPDYGSNPGYPNYYMIYGPGNGIDYHPNGSLECGDTIIAKNFVLDVDLINCPEHGLIIGADDITLDCNGHIIDGGGMVGISYGIFMNNKSNVTIKNCNVSGFGYGIYLNNHSQNNLITNNFVYNISNVGIDLYYCTDNTVTSNIAVDCRIGISLYKGSNSTLINNTVINSNQYGVYITPSADPNDYVDFVVFSDNTVKHSDDGFRFGKNRYCNFTNNVAINNTYGLRSYKTMYSNIVGTVVRDNLYGIYLDHANKFLLKGTNATGNKYGIRLYYPYWGKILGNTAENNEHGIYLYTSSIANSELFNNTLINNSKNGIYVFSGYLNITNNIAKNNPKGIYLYYGGNNRVKNNSIIDNSVGILVNESYDNVIWNNNFSNIINVIENVTVLYNDWNLSQIGNYWSDFGNNNGYPEYYEVSVNGTDYWPLGFTRINLEILNGWNLISLPVQPPNTVTESLLSKLNQIIVFNYNTSDEWKVYDSNGAIPNTLSNMDFGSAYWLKSNSNQNFIFHGNEVSKVINLEDGLNLIGYPSLESKNISFVFNEINLTSVFSYENSTWKSYNPKKPDYLNTLKTMKPGYGYWVNVDENVSLEIS